VALPPARAIRYTPRAAREPALLRGAAPIANANVLKTKTKLIDTFAHQLIE